MSIFAFNPIDGLLNKSVYPTSPKSEDEARNQIQSPLNQLRDYINNNCIVKDGSVAFTDNVYVGNNLTVVGKIGNTSQYVSHIYSNGMDIKNDIWLGTSSKYQNGFSKLPNGMYIQWGNSAIAVNQTQTVITLPMTFPYGNMCTTLTNFASLKDVYLGIRATGYITVYHTSSATARTIDWICIGW